MPKLSTTSNASLSDDAEAKKKAAAEAATRCRPCPRCRVMLVLERRYESRGLSGAVTLHETYICPACDARFQYNPPDGRWKELT